MEGRGTDPDLPSCPRTSEKAHSTRLGESLWSGFIADSFGPPTMPRGKDYLGDPRRTRVNRDVEDEAAAGAAARPRCSQTTLRGTYLVAFDGVDISGNAQVPFAAAELEVYDGNGNIEGLGSYNSNGTITSKEPFSGTYTVNADCTGTTTYAGGEKYDLFIALMAVCSRGSRPIPPMVWCRGLNSGWHARESETAPLSPGGGCYAPALPLLALIHATSWNGHSPKFACRPLGAATVLNNI